ncbi:MAG: hypothetical protein J7L73_08715 [Anaerolineales bacterium]|nr:hypothetical protein [Anaerolineales bacterium]
MEESLAKKILSDWEIDNLPRDQQIVKIFEKVRDIPFGRMGSRDPKDVYERNKGTCSGKNFLLKGLYKTIGVKTKDIICLQRWKDLTWFPDDRYGIVNLPDEMKQMLEETEIVDFHNYVKILVDGKWVTIDVTIDLPLKKLGFYTTEHWDGKSDMPLCFVGTHKVWDCGDNGSEKKAQLTAALPKNIQEARNLFLENLTKWLDDLREKGEI